MAPTIALSTVAGIFAVAVLTLVIDQFTPGSFGWVSVVAGLIVIAGFAGVVAWAVGHMR
jgi:hypothetical protein